MTVTVRKLVCSTRSVVDSDSHLHHHLFGNNTIGHSSLDKKFDLTGNFVYNKALFP